MNVLVTGGTGYIGSHTTVELLNAEHNVVIVDNLVNSSASVIEAITKITSKTPLFIEGDIRDTELLDQIFTQHHFDVVFHFAGLKAVGEAEKNPLIYFDNNVTGSITLFRTMLAHQVKKIVFSSSATIYGDPGLDRYDESMKPEPINVYGRTKWMIEQILQDIVTADPDWKVAILRYFNPVGAHPSGLIGENPKGVPNNLMPYLLKVAIQEYPSLNVFGDDYPTPDGTGMRDYIHVVDLAKGHIKSLDYINKKEASITVNLGTGVAYSVLDLVASFEKVTGIKIPYQFAPRRKGDLAKYYADPSMAKEKLGWEAQYNLDYMCEDAWRWQTQSKNIK